MSFGATLSLPMMSHIESDKPASRCPTRCGKVWDCSSRHGFSQQLFDFGCGLDTAAAALTTTDKARVQARKQLSSFARCHRAVQVAGDSARRPAAQPLRQLLWASWLATEPSPRHEDSEWFVNVPPCRWPWPSRGTRPPLCQGCLQDSLILKTPSAQGLQTPHHIKFPCMRASRRHGIRSRLITSHDKVVGRPAKAEQLCLQCGRSWQH